MEPWRALRSNVLHFGTGQAGWLHVPRKAHREREQKLDTWNAFFFLKSPAYLLHYLCRGVICHPHDLSAQ